MSRLSTDLSLFLGLVGEVNHVTALEPFSVLMMMVYYELGFPGHREDGKPIPRRLRELKNTK